MALLPLFAASASRLVVALTVVAAAIFVSLASTRAQARVIVSNRTEADVRSPTAAAGSGVRFYMRFVHADCY